MIYFWIAAKDPLGFTVNLSKINGLKSNMLVTMVTRQMAINSDLTSNQMMVTIKKKNLLSVFKLKTKQ